MKNNIVQLILWILVCNVILAFAIAGGLVILVEILKGIT